MREYDLVVFGATSFVGQILCRRLVERVGIDGDVRWAIAGRSESKLAEVATATGADVPRLVADAVDGDAMAALAASTAVVASTVGPYAKYGSALVGAVAAAGTDYCDLTGEAQWMRAMIDEHHESARASGARIVHSCGFDSIPSDLGVWFTQREATARYGEPCTRIGMRVRAAKGGASGGTVASLLNVVDEARRDQGGRVDVAASDRLAARIHDAHRIARLEPVQRRARHIHFVAEHPQMAGTQAPIFATLEHQDRIIGLGHGTARPRRRRSLAVGWRRVRLVSTSP